MTDSTLSYVIRLTQKMLRDPGMLDAKIAQLLNSNIEDEEFNGFVVEK